MRARSASVLLLLAVVGAILAARPAPAATQVGFQAQSYAGFGAESVGGAITGQKPESKLWYQDGSWWGAMLSPSAGGAHRIHRLQGTTWVDTGTLIDPRPATKEDVLSVGSTLYILSRAHSSIGSSKLRRYTYSSGSYTLVPGFPVDIPGTGAETSTIAQDSLGNLWLTYTQGNQVYVAHTTGADNVWGAPFVIPVSRATGLTSDDISAIIGFTDSTGPAIGVMWSNQKRSSGATNDYFAVHRDGAPDGTWTRETALNGPAEADDHINLKTFEGRVFAAVKTSKDDAGSSSDPLIRLLVRSSNGSWSKQPVALVSETSTRPITILDIDPATRQVYVFMTIGVNPSVHGIAYKKASIDNPSFPSNWTVFIQGPNDEQINDATSTKQNLGASTGITVMASDTQNYWWNKIGGGGGNTAPTAANKTATTSQDTPVSIQLSGTDAETCNLTFTPTQPAHGSVSAVTNQACAAGSPNSDTATVTYTPTSGYSGSDSFTYTTSDGTLTSSAATVSLTITATPDFSLSASPSSQTVTAGSSTTYTVTVNHTGGHTAAASLSASGLPSGASASFNPASTTTTSTMTVTTLASTPSGTSVVAISGNDGSATRTTTVSLTVNPAATPDFSLSASPSSQTVTAGNSTTYTVTVSHTGGHNAAATLSASGLPSGASASFSPASTTTTSTMTVTTTTSTPAGTSVVTISGNDGSATRTTTVSLTVSNAVPTAANKSVTTTSPNPVVVTLSGTDVETCELFFSANNPTNGSLSTLTNNGCTGGSPNSDTASITYTPNTGFSGTDTFTYRTNDGAQNSALATVTVTVSGGGGGAIAFVKNVATFADPGTAATSQTITIPAGGVAAGNLLVVRVQFEAASSPPTNQTATDSKGNAYTRHAVADNASGTQSVIFGSKLTTALVSGDTVTLSWTNSAWRSGQLTEFSGVDNVLDVAASNATGNSATPSATLTPASPAVLLFSNVSIYTPPSDPTFTEDGDSVGGDTWHALAKVGSGSASWSRAAYKITSTAVGQTYNPTLGAARLWAESLVAFRRAS